MTDKARSKGKDTPSPYEKRALSDEEADRRAWEIVNKPDQSARKSISRRRSRPRYSYNEEQ